MDLQKIKKPLVVIATLLLCANCFASNSVKVDEAVMKIFHQYENTEGVDCMRIVQGEGLGLIKMMFNKEFGRKFMKGVNCIVIIDYGKASEQISAEIRSNMDSFTTLLEEIDLKGEEFEEDEYARFFATIKDETHISDFVAIFEDPEDKMLIYMGGEIIADFE